MKTKTLIKSILSKVKAAAVATYLFFALKVTPVLASEPAIDGKSASKGWDAFKDLVETGFKGAGVVFIVLGALKVYPVIKTGEQNPEAISDAIKNFIIAAMCLGISFVIGWFENGLTITG